MSYNERFKQLAKEKKPRPEPQKNPKLKDAKYAALFSACAFACSVFCFIPFAFIAFVAGALVLLRYAFVYKEKYLDDGGINNKYVITANIFIIASTTLSILLTVYAFFITYAKIFS